MNRRLALAASALAVALTAAAVAAAGLPRLPGPIALPQGGDSPGVVTFDHAAHVDAKAPRCTPCHPRLFPMLHENALQKGAVNHHRMEQGQACGACHGKGKAAFAFDDDCTACHAG